LTSEPGKAAFADHFRLGTVVERLEDLDLFVDHSLEAEHDPRLADPRGPIAGSASRP
jgi:hypothetical protein